MIIRYTSPVDAFVIEGIDLTGCVVWVSYEQGQRQLDVPAEVSYDGSDTHLSVHLSQEETGLFFEGVVSVQVNWIYPDGQRDATKVLDGCEWGRNLIDRVM